LLSALAVFLVYLPAVNFQLVWDDTIFLRDMPTYRDPDLWVRAIFAPFVLSPNYFRPLALLTFVAEMAVAGLSPTLLHLTNVLLHAVNTALVGLLTLRLLRRLHPPSTLQLPTSIIASLLYGLHPALVEGVAFVSSRFDLLMTMLLLLALLADLLLRERGLLWRPLLVGLAFFLAALAKEMAVALVLALPCWHLATGAWTGPAESARARWPKNGLVYLALLLSGGLYLLLRYAGLGHLLVAVSGQVDPTGSPLQHLLLAVQSLGQYVLLILWPFTTLSPIHYSVLPVPVDSAQAWLFLVLDLSLIAGLVVLIRKWPAAGWLALAGLLALVPVVNILPLELGGGSFVAERYLLFPLTLLVLAAGSLLFPLLARVWSEGLTRPSLPRLAGAGLLLLWFLGAVATVQLTLPNWRDDLTLWTWAAERAPRSATPPTNLSLQYTNMGLFQRGLEYADQAVRLDPQNGDAWDNAGLALFHMGAYTDAQVAFEQAVSLQPANALYWNNLAGALRERGDLENAEKILLDQVLRLDPNLPVGHLNLGIVYLMADRPDLAEVHLQQAVQLLPPTEAKTAQDSLARSQEPARWLRLGDLHLSQGEFPQALAAYDRAGKLGAQAADVIAGLSAALIGQKDWENAARLLEQGLALAPNDARLYNNAGVVARETGDIERARQMFSRAVELAPQWELPRTNLEGLPR